MLTRLVDLILNLPPDILSQWGYIILFIFSVIESLPLLGLAIPGGVIVIASGFFAHIGILHTVPTIIVAAVGAMIGDGISYALGRKYGYGFMTRLGRYIFLKPVHLDKAKSVLHKHPGKALIVGRFHALTRCIMPFAAGASDVPSYVFFPFMIAGAILWAVFNIFIGIVFGESFMIASKYVGVIFFVALGISILILYSYRFITKFTAKNRRFIDKYQIYPVVLSIISVYVVAKLSESVIMGVRIHRLDTFVNFFFEHHRAPWLTNFFVFLTLLCTPTNLTIVGVGLTIYFVYRHRWYFLTLLPVSMIAGLISQSLLKRSIHILRPLDPLVPTADFSFPSGHATIATIFFGLLAYFFRDVFPNKKWRDVYVGACIVLISLVSVSRIYLNAHWLSDVIAGIFLGIFWVSFFIILFHFFRSISTKRVEGELVKELKESDLA